MCIASFYFDQRPLGLEHIDASIEGFNDEAVDRESLRDQLEAIAKKGYYLAQYNLTIFALRACNHIYQSKAVDFLTKAAEQGHVESWYLLSTRYKNQIGLNRIVEGELISREDAILESQRNQKRVKCLTEAVKRKHLEATYELGICHLQQLEGTKDFNQGFVLLREAAMGGYVKAMTELAVRYRQGIGCVKDIEQALKYSEMASNVEEFPPEAPYEAGWYYYTNHEYAKAMKLLLKSAKKDYGPAAYMVAVCLWNAQGSPDQRKNLAIKWLIKASKLGKFHASEALADHYAFERKLTEFEKYRKIAQEQKENSFKTREFWIIPHLKNPKNK